MTFRCPEEDIDEESESDLDPDKWVEGTRVRFIADEPKILSQGPRTGVLRGGIYETGKVPWIQDTSGHRWASFYWALEIVEATDDQTASDHPKPDQSDVMSDATNYSLLAEASQCYNASDVTDLENYSPDETYAASLVVGRDLMRPGCRDNAEAWELADLGHQNPGTSSVVCTSDPPPTLADQCPSQGIPRKTPPSGHAPNTTVRTSTLPQASAQDIRQNLDRQISQLQQQIAELESHKSQLETCRREFETRYYD